MQAQLGGVSTLVACRREQDGCITSGRGEQFRPFQEPTGRDQELEPPDLATAQLLNLDAILVGRCTRITSAPRSASFGSRTTVPPGRQLHHSQSDERTTPTLAPPASGCSDSIAKPSHCSDTSERSARGDLLDADPSRGPAERWAVSVVDRGKGLDG